MPYQISTKNMVSLPSQCEADKSYSLHIQITAGQVVRVAPDELAFSSAQSWRDIYGHSVKGKNYFHKTDWYAGVGDLPSSISTEPDPQKHGAMRRNLASAFSNSTLKTQADVIMGFLDLFVSQIKKYDKGEGIPVEEWFNWLTFDIVRIIL